MTARLEPFLYLLVMDAWYSNYWDTPETEAVPEGYNLELKELVEDGWVEQARPLLVEDAHGMILSKA